MPRRGTGWNVRSWPGISLLVLTLLCSVGWTQGGLPYQTGFEEDEGFKADIYEAYIDSGGDWKVLEGSAAIIEVPEPSDLAQGQMLEVHPSSVVDTTRSAADEDPVIWLQGVYRTVPQDTPPAVEGLDPSSALMYFDQDDGIMVYNGLTSAWEPIGYPVDPSGNTWYRITIRLNFVQSTWDIYVGDDDIPEATAIGFKDTGLSRYNGFRCRSGEASPGYLDNFYVGQGQPPSFATPTPTPSPTPQPPQLVGTEFLLYSIYWDPMGLNETPFAPLNLYSDEVIDWLDVYEYMKEWQVR